MEPPFALSVDLEEYFQVQAFARYVRRDEWEAWPSRVEPSTHRLLDLFGEMAASATFFTLGWIARRHPRLVREIAARGHEIASHGMTHQMLTEQTAESFRADARDSRALLEDVTGKRVIGFRAPSYSVNGSTLWAIDVLVETGYEYDSSVYPIRRRRYGYGAGPTRPGKLRTSRCELAEFPLPTLGIAGVRVPVLAGAYLRLWPAWITLFAERVHREGEHPLVVNIHPWEIDPDQPTIGPGRLRTWTHYAGLGRTETILRRVLSRSRYRDVATRLRELGLLAPAAVQRSEVGA
jgi:polysaccharide deacetylase family protein (PEP-CTERM system associated)